MNDSWTLARSWLPIAAAVAGAWAIASALYLAGDWRGHVHDRQYLVVLALCIVVFLAGGATLILAALEMVS